MSVQRKAVSNTKPRQAGGLPDGFPVLVPAGHRQPTAARAWLRMRHVVSLLIFLAMVPGVAGVVGWYLFDRAQDQYSSTFGFVIHAEGEESAAGLLSSVPGISALAGSSSKDADILYAYLDSQALVEAVDSQVDLRALWAEHHATDPVFALKEEASIEDMTDYWRRMVHVSYETGPGLLEVEVRGFAPKAAQSIAREVEQASNALINRLGSIAREDRLAHSQTELSLASQRLSDARRALTEFRVRNQMVDPMADLTGEMGVIHQLQQALADEIVGMELLRRTVRGGEGTRRGAINDTRVGQAELRIEVLRNRIEQERARLGDTQGPRDLARLMGRYEELTVAVEIAQEAYALALAAHEANRAAADRQTRYLASYSPPTLAEKSVYPKRWAILASVAAGLVLCWSIVMLIVYSLRDRF
ncbi:sugar transporter [Pseudooceanicola sp. MF1-13]|uniref:sugar transporter n=1 Tax=Pseudooceanicola sp. MF1-13 TaxID=3379095 RepID=UPI003891D211